MASLQLAFVKVTLLPEAASNVRSLSFLPILVSHDTQTSAQHLIANTSWIGLQTVSLEEL
mgnify:CR=1 FL=1